MFAPHTPCADMLQLLPCLSSVVSLDSTTLLCHLITWPISWYRMGNNLLKGSYCKSVLKNENAVTPSKKWHTSTYVHRCWIHLCTPNPFTLFLTITLIHHFIWYSQGFIFKFLSRTCGKQNVSLTKTAGPHTYVEIHTITHMLVLLCLWGL